MEILSNVIFRNPIFPFKSSTVYNGDYGRRKVFKEAIYLSSPSVHYTMNRQCFVKSEDLNGNSKLRTVLCKYSIRASTRCTPFGLFATVGLGKWSNTNNIVLHDDIRRSIVRESRLDMGVLCKIATHISKLPDVKYRLKYYSNTSIYRVQENLRYVEHVYQRNKRRYLLSKVNYSIYIDEIISAANKGETYGVLVNILTAKGIGFEESNRVILALIDNNLLISELEPTLSGPNYLQTLIDSLKKIMNGEQIHQIIKLVNKLEKIGQLIKELDLNVINEVEAYEAVLKEVNDFFSVPKEAIIVQTDSFRMPQKAKIDEKIKYKLIDVVNFLNKITPIQKKSQLEAFVQLFKDRYQEQSIPLLQALDPEVGIGYPPRQNVSINPLIDDIVFLKENKDFNITWNPFEERLLDLLVKTSANKKYSIELSEDDFKGIDTSANLPHSLSIIFNILNANDNLIRFKVASGPSAACLLGRFGQNNREIQEIIGKIAKHESVQSEQQVFAEIIHLPQDRTGNVLIRYHAREYEIALLTKSSYSHEKQIDLRDLYLSIKEDKVILRSKKLNAEIVPRLGNAHNYKNDPIPVYYFLCDLQSQYFEKSSLNFTWGAISSNFKFLPRVSFKGTIIHPATWNLSREDFMDLLDSKYDRKLFQAYCQTFNLPTSFLLVDGDNELLINATHEQGVDVFISEIKNKQKITIEEFLFTEESAAVYDVVGNGYTNECVAFLLNNKNGPRYVNNVEELNQLQGANPEWIYLKIYLGVSVSDDLLLEVIKPVLSYLISSSLVNFWFFIRYRDPEPHIRLRMRLTDKEFFFQVLNSVYLKLHAQVLSNVIFKIQIDKYTPELSRYGSSTISESEELFFYDSQCFIDALPYFMGENGADIRSKFAIRCTDQLLADFNLTTQEKHELMINTCEYFFKENKGDKALKIQLDNKFRKLRYNIKSLLSNLDEDQSSFYNLNKIIERRSLLNREPIKRLHDKSHETNLDIARLVINYMHMMHNRIFVSRQRTNEFVIYEMLRRYYKSLLSQESPA